MKEDPILEQPESDESALLGDERTRQIIEWPPGSGVEAVRIVLSKRQGGQWLAHTTLTQSLESDSRIELIFLEGAAEPVGAQAEAFSFAPSDSALAFDLMTTERVLGMDVSYAQGRHVDFQKAADAGVNFCFIRAGSGRTERDDNFEHNYVQAGKAGMLRGIYYYMYPEASATVGNAEDRAPEGQARRFAGLLKADAELGAVLDVEQKGLSAEQVKRFVDEFQKHDPYGRPITIYTAAWFWNQWRGYSGPKVQWAAGHPLWVAHYTHMEEPIKPSVDFRVAVPKPWSKYLLHQWTSVGGPLVGQSRKGLDLNYFAGSMAELQAWAKSGEVVRRPTAVVGTKYVTAHVLNLRAGPSTQHEVLRKLLKDTAVTILEEGEWSKVVVDGVEGYVYAGFLTDKKPPKKVAAAKKKIDMANYFLPPEGQDAGDIVILQNNYGQGNERQQLQREKGPEGLISYVTKNRQFEKRIIGNKTIDLVLDTSPGEGEMYVVKGQWLPRRWAEGEDFRRKEVVTFFRKSDGQPVEGKETYRSESLIKFAKRHGTWRSPGNIQLKDVVELHWIAGGRVDERYWFARNLGLVGWMKYDNRESYVVELVKRGSQHDNKREKVPDVS